MGSHPKKTDEDFASEWVLFQGASPDRFPLGDVDAGIQAAGDACPDALATSTPTPSGRLLTVVHCPSADAALGSFFDGLAITAPSDLYSADFLTTQLGVAGGASPDGRVWEVNFALEAPEVGVASILTTAYGPGNGAECEVPVVDLPVGGKLVPVEPGMPCTNRADAGLTETFDPMTVNAEAVSNAIIQIRQDRELLQQLSIRVVDGTPTLIAANDEGRSFQIPLG